MIIIDPELGNFYQFMKREMTIQNRLNESVDHNPVAVGFYDKPAILFKNNYFNRLPLVIIYFPVYLVHIFPICMPLNKLFQGTAY